MIRTMTDKKTYPSDTQPRKSIRLSDEQVNNWDSDLIKWVLEGDNIDLVLRLKEGTFVSSAEPPEQSNMKERILQDKIDQGEKFRSGFTILAKAFSVAMRNKAFQTQIGAYFRQIPNGADHFAEIKTLLKKIGGAVNGNGT